jgi:CTP:molybdopterin cytidylyltransferase MocA
LVAPAAQTFAALVTALMAGDVLAAVPVVDDQWRPLPVALRRSARAPLAEAFSEGERAVHRAIERLEFVPVDAGPIADADTPGDLPDRR